MTSQLLEREKFTLWRRRNNVKLKDVADYLGCSDAYICQFERGKTDMTLAKRQKYEEFIRKYAKE